MSKLLNVMWLALVSFFVWYCYSVYDGLPEKMAVHFNADGQPDGWGSKESFFTTMIITTLAMNALFFLIFALIKKIPESILNLPWKDYWFGDEEKKVLAYQKLQSIMSMSGIFFNIVFIMIIYFTVQVNMNTSSSFSDFLQDNMLWGSLVATFLFVAGIIVPFIPPRQKENS